MDIVILDKQKILLLPSWYPSEIDPITGSFFYEQALLLSKKYDFHVLHFERKRYSLGSYLKQSRKHHTQPLSSALPGEYIRIPQLHCYAPISEKIAHNNQQKAIVTACVAIQQLIDKGWKPDLIHCHSVDGFGALSGYVAKHFGIPLIITEHNHRLINNSCNLSQVEQRSIANAYQQASQVLCVSQDLKRQLLMHNYQCDPKIVGNYVDDSLFTTTEKQDDTPFNILCVSYDSHLKDNKTLAKTLLEINQSTINNFTVTLIGKGLKELFENNYPEVLKNLGKKVEFVAVVERTQMPDYYQRCNVLLSTSVAETFGLAQCEAIFCGRPIVAVKNGGVDEMIKDVNGILCPVGEPQELAEAIAQIYKKTFITDPQKIHQSVVNKFSRNAFFERQDGFYQRVIESYSDHKSPAI